MSTPLVTSSDGKSKAYAEIKAEEVSRQWCENTASLFVSTSGHTAFRQVYRQRPSAMSGNANSFAPVGWSPEGRWLLVETATANYASDAGGTGILLYDRRTGKVVLPSLDRMIKRRLKKQCSINVYEVTGFDAASHVLLRLADYWSEGDTEPETHCFRGIEEWALDPVRGTIRPISP